MRNIQREKVAIIAAAIIKSRIRDNYLIDTSSPIGLILGTGWGDVLEITHPITIPFANLPGFIGLEKLEGHARELVMGIIAGKFVIALRGRVHMNEAPNDQNIAKMVRLQVEMLFHLGVQNLIVTSAVGSLNQQIEIGSIAVIDGFITLYAPEMPLWAGEFCSPEDAISNKLKVIAHEEKGKLKLNDVGHVMLRGPFFEGRKYDKQLLVESGAKVVGMSMLPEACIASLYGANFLGLGFVTNDMFATHSHEENLQRAKSAAKHLGSFLTRIISKILI